MSTNFRAAVQELASQGIHPRWTIPVTPYLGVIADKSPLDQKSMGKAPGRYLKRNRSWAGLAGDYVKDGIAKSDLDGDMGDWPTPNAGLLGRGYPAIDSDAESPEAAGAIWKAVNRAFPEAVFALRRRGQNARALFAFAGYPNDQHRAVRTRRVTYELGGMQHGLDIIGYGNQYVATGQHPSGDKYEWSEHYPLSRDLTPIEDMDVERFLDILEDEIENAGGMVGRTSGGGVGGEEIEFALLDPVMPIEVVRDGLAKLPNTPETFEHRDQFVAMIAAIKSALGNEADQHEDVVRDWACADQTWCPDEYFDKVWDSIRTTVRQGQGALDRIFRKNGVGVGAKAAFDDNTTVPGLPERKAERAQGRDDLFATVASRFVFREVNDRKGENEYQMRDTFNVSRAWKTLNWWQKKIIDADVQLVDDILLSHDSYTPNAVGLANFLRDLKDRFPNIFFDGETLHPGVDTGIIINESLPDGHTARLLNMSVPSAAIRHGERPDPNPARSRADVDRILEFMDRMFGREVGYELDTLAYMAQTGKRPGNLLFMVGEQGVGKSMLASLEGALFDGTHAAGSISGVSLINESSRRFVWGAAEGKRIVVVKELPSGSGKGASSLITPDLRRLVDAGEEGEFFDVERKGQDIYKARNHFRIIISSNYADALFIDQGERRIFYVQVGITLDNRPNEDYYRELGDIIADPERLGAFWRYLKSRDYKANGYSPNRAPPVTFAKSDRMLQEIPQDYTRHAIAAIEWLSVSGVIVFDADRLRTIMTRMARNEHFNTGRGEKVDYSEPSAKTSFGNAMRSVMHRKFLMKMERPDWRTTQKRETAVYVINGHDKMLLDLVQGSKSNVYDTLDRFDSVKLTDNHPMASYRDPDDAAED